MLNDYWNISIYKLSDWTLDQTNLYCSRQKVPLDLEASAPAAVVSGGL